MSEIHFEDKGKPNQEALIQNYNQIISLLQNYSKSQNKFKTICPNYSETKYKYPKIQFKIKINNISHNIYIQSNTKTHAIINLIQYIIQHQNNPNIFAIKKTKSKTKIIPIHKHIPCLYMYLDSQFITHPNYKKTQNKPKKSKTTTFQTIKDYISKGGLIEVV